MHFTQPATKCSMWLWKSQGTPFLALIILEHSRILIDGLAVKMLVLNILQNFDGRKASFCPGCGEKTDKPSLMKRGLFLCRKCKRQTSITAGTLFHGSHKPLRTWFLAMWFVTSQKHGASALGLKRVLGLGSYNTAWTWLHKLCRAMVRPGRDQLTGEVEVDETYVGGVGTKIRGRGAKRKTIVAIAAEVRGRGPGRIRMTKIPDLSAPSLRRFVRDNVQRGAEIRTDGWSGYNVIEVMGYKHTMTSISNSGDPAHVFMSRVHRVASLLDRWWLGIHQGAIRPSHLDY